MLDPIEELYRLRRLQKSHTFAKLVYFLLGLALGVLALRWWVIYRIGWDVFG